MFSLIFDRVRGSHWFIPSLLVVCAIVLAGAVRWVDGTLQSESLSGLPLVFNGTAADARAILGTIAGSTITIVGVVFSMTIVALQLASTQFGPRLLRNFMRDTTTKLVLGLFVATFVYCVLIMSSVTGPAETAFVPQLSVTLGIVLAMVSLGGLVWFIDHLARSIHVSAVIDAVARELDHTIERRFPKTIGEGATAAPTSTPDSHRAFSIRSTQSGYLRYIDADHVMSEAEAHDLVVSICARPGHFVFIGEALADVWAASQPSDAIMDSLRGVFVFGTQRTMLQDARFGFDQLVELALRALSPGINDPQTANACIDRIGSALGQLVTRELPAEHRVDSQGTLRVIGQPAPFAAFLSESLGPIRRNGCSHLTVALRLLSVIGRLLHRASRADDREALRAEAIAIRDQAMNDLALERDQQAVRDACDSALANDFDADIASVYAQEHR